jgi:energy-coupling factor transporter ATP-binding protein EcfA2
LSINEGKIGLLIGDSGCGKTACLEQYAIANKNTAYVILDSGMTATTMFSAIARSINIDSSGSLGNVTRRIIECLLPRHIILILDEASWLSVHQLNLLRQIISIKSKCPMILAGNGDLLTTIIQSPARRGYECLDQFTARMSYTLDLNSENLNEDGGLYTVEDIRKLYEYGGIRLTGNAVNMLCRISRTPRSARLHTCTNIILALHTSRKVLKSGIIDSPDILQAITDLRLPIQDRLPVGFEKMQDEQKEQAISKSA